MTTSPSSLILDLAPILPASLVGWPEPIPIPPTGYCPTCDGGGGSVGNVIMPQLVATLGDGTMTTEYTYTAPNKPFAVPCSTVSFGAMPCVTDTSLCWGPTVTWPQDLQYVYSSPLNSLATINGKTIAEIIQNPFGTVYNMSPLTGVYAGTIAAKTFPKITSTFTEPFKINPGDFVNDGKVYIVISWTCQLNTPAMQACKTFSGVCDQNYTFQIQVLLNLTSANPYWARCCAGILISNEERQAFCPTEYSRLSSACEARMQSYCTVDNPTDSVCGCYPDYIKAEIVDQNPYIKSWLKGTKLSSGCATSCSPATAYIGADMMQDCKMNLTICQAEVANMGGEINTGTNGIKITQECNGDDGNGTTPTNGDGNGDGTTTTPTISKTVIIASIAAGAVLLLVLAVLVFMIL